MLKRIYLKIISNLNPFQNETHLLKNGFIVCKNFSHNSSETEKNIKIAVIGSGPAGFYTTQQLIRSHPRVTVDIFEKFPVPFGLVRFGVAPDHQDVKNVINSFTNTALNSRTAFIGNVSIGSDISLAEIRDNYNAVVLCYGAEQDRLLGIEGEGLPNVISARRFVGWYNGVPQDTHIPINLECETAVIIGNGNVAIDCARILLTPPQQLLNKTDITNHSLEKLKRSKIKCVYIIGRRGPLQVSFTIKELRELTKLQNCKTIISAHDCNHIEKSIIESLSRPRKRLTEFLIEISKDNTVNCEFDKTCIIKFLRTPKAIKGDEVKGVTNIVLDINKLEHNLTDGSVSCIPTGKCEEITAGLVLRSIGSKSVSIDPSLPFDEKKGVIKNENGRITECGPGLYCSGWAGTGASGVILNTMNASFQVAKNIIEDIEANELGITDKLGSEAILKKLKSKGVNVVYFDDWTRIDQFEQQLGSNLGKPREKIVDINQMVDIAKKR